MEPTQALSEDHLVIERAVACLELAAHRLDTGEAVRLGLFVDIADFIRDFADGCHHRKEEEALFPALEAAGLPRDGGPVGVMLSEHEEGRRLAAALRSAAETLAAGDESAARDVVENAEGYAALLRRHIFKEDNVLFMMAQQVLGPEKQAALAGAFERIERECEGVRAKYLTLVDALVLELDRSPATAA